MRVEPYGAFLEFAPGKDGLLHISRVRLDTRVERVEDVMNLGDEVEVKIIEVDREGRVRFSRKELLPKPEGYEERPPRDGGDRGGGGRVTVAADRGGGGDRGRATARRRRRAAGGADRGAPELTDGA